MRIAAGSPMIDRMADLDDIAALSWPKRTERLLIRPVSKDDFEAMWQIRRQESVGRWMGALSAEFEPFCEFIADPERMGKTLVIERAGVLVGDLMLAPETPWSQVEVVDRVRGVHAEIGWCIDPAMEGQGYATEAVRELIRLSFEELGFHRLVAHCFADNEPSWRLMERVGMRREAHTRQDSLHRSGVWLDGFSYALLADEWREAQGAG